MLEVQKPTETAPNAQRWNNLSNNVNNVLLDYNSFAKYSHK